MKGIELPLKLQLPPQQRALHNLPKQKKPNREKSQLSMNRRNLMHIRGNRALNHPNPQNTFKQIIDQEEVKKRKGTLKYLQSIDQEEVKQKEGRKAGVI